MLKRRRSLRALHAEKTSTKAWSACLCWVSALVHRPVLFLIYINDLPTLLTTECSIFADDTTAYCVGTDTNITRPTLSKDLDTASSWASTSGMLFDVEKSTHLEIMSRKRPLNLNGNVTMGGMVVPRASTQKHPGVTLNSSLTWQDHVNNVYTACARKVGMALMQNDVNFGCCGVTFRC